ncbi:NUDIX hydrolase [Truepera radiovictrix]|uniref:NUDIX hydrolase n=1 Tax=Truepera radiovictrix (strain DSM 17093 / CIP 108686 / LMG 22925 / RQ-24) TaxID=649638 RepID=D7CX14_TRURR|nr:NUDIX domain-containing protein [Truepera radiovictrix]ADI14522.1 NUDIX hydrolase [Truepera radiovictrix DSM 17093]WMT56926.1 NUDIX domain-containing protein [Truepera radiovictrix]
MPRDVSVTVGAHLFNLRVAAIIRRQGNVLVNRLRDQDFWFLPGGRVQEGEATREALLRELREELGAECRAHRPVFFHENFFRHDGKRFHEVCVYYDVELPPDAATLSDVSAADGGIDLEWLELTQLSSINLQPPFLPSRLQTLPLGLEHVVSRN